ncbi:MAG TPA: bifunctional hydroxymethylpyrimidine kinase/phosphomethylpyrimidine kinase [Chakrabartia sp.]|jgi:hydroxymethylpyrimidine/phosphomethylpyrimidine kinase|nr:bifunctional hydroxymethylpyrimidine kinase/phosphomethylpyrimidine kinase [Chakrabartia sp.]
MTARILIIAGSDSGGGAGIQADIKTVTMLGGHAMTAITAITAQNTLGVDAILAIPPAMITAQIDAVVNDLGVDAVKIGMLGTRETIACVEAAVARLPQDVPVVVDPVLVATSGASLSEADTIPALHSLFSRATLVTPNLPELEALGGEAAVLIHGCALLVKGGHAEGDRLTDRLVTASGTLAAWEDSRIATRHTHGTGCTLASAIATGLGEGLPLEQAIARARKFVRAALRAAPGLGAGHGPMGHQAVRLTA